MRGVEKVIIDSPEASELFNSLKSCRHLALAVSGGADSVAMMWLMARWRDAQSGGGPVLSILTVDHQLRATSASEAGQTARWACELGCAHHILVWRGEKPESGIQARARAERYRLMTRWCRANGADGLVLAHHLDDQAETVLMRLGHGSGLDGLCGMRAASWRDGVKILRPFLGIPKARLTATLQSTGQLWLEDPSNQDQKYERVRLRAVLAGLDDGGTGAEALCQSAKRLSEIRDALDIMADALIAGAVQLSPAGYCLIDIAKMKTAVHETGLRVLRRVLMATGGGQYPPTREKLARLYDRMIMGDGAGGTLAGCRVFKKAGSLWIVREIRGGDVRTLRLEAGCEEIWDNRFAVKAPDGDGAAYHVRMLGDEGWQLLKTGEHKARALPAAAGRTLLSFWRGGRLVTVPHFEEYSEYTASFAAVFVQKYRLMLTD